MTTEVITISPETLVSDLAQVLEGKNIGGVPVVDATGALVGIVTQSDLVARVQELEMPPALNILDLHVYLQIPSHLFQQVQRMLGTTVGDIMTRSPVTVTPDTPVAQIAALMDQEKVHTLPVVKAGKMVGIIGKMDLIRAVALSRSGATA